MSLRIPFHRTAGIVAGVLIGLAGAAAAAAPASAHTGALTAASACLDEGWKATWSLTTSDTGDHAGVLSDVTVDIDYLAPPPHGGGAPKLPELADGAEITGGPTVSDSWELSPDVAGATLALTVTWKAGDDVHAETLTARADAPPNCQWPPRGVQSSYSASSSCTTMTVTLVNPPRLRDEVALRLTTSEGEERILHAGPGETGSETFPATAGFTIGVTSAGGPQPPGGERPHRLTYEQPANCTPGDGDGGEATGGGTTNDDRTADDDAAAGGGGENGSLPVTGAAAGAVAGIAAALLATGVALFVVARRRPVKFTA